MELGGVTNAPRSRTVVVAASLVVFVAIAFSPVRWWSSKQSISIPVPANSLRDAGSSSSSSSRENGYRQSGDAGLIGSVAADTPTIPSNRMLITREVLSMSGIRLISPETNSVSDKAIVILDLSASEVASLNLVLNEMSQIAQGIRRDSSKVKIDASTVEVFDEKEPFKDLESVGAEKILKCLDDESKRRLTVLGLDYMMSSPWILGLKKVTLDESTAVVQYACAGMKFSVQMPRSEVERILLGIPAFR